MIRRIKIKNFRSLDVDFQLDPVTVLIGRSGTGKTNFVSALRFLREILRHGVNFDDNIFSLTNKENSLSYEIEFGVSQLTEHFRYCITIGATGISNEALYIDQSLFISRDGKNLRGDYDLVDHRSNVRYFASDQYGKHCILNDETNTKCCFSMIQGNQKVSIARIALTQGLACYDFPGSVCTDVEQNAQASEGLTDRAENYSAVFNAISRDLTKLESWNLINRYLQNLNKSVDTISFNSQNEQEILVTHKFGDHVVSFDIGKESEGFRRFFAHLLAVYQTPPKQTLVFEEPERGIHPRALGSLAEILRYSPEEGHGQVILTTHSPQLLDCFEPESIRVVVMEDGVTKIGPMIKEQRKSLEEELLFPGELLTVTDAVIAYDALEEVSSHAS